MDREMIEQLKRISFKRSKVCRITEKEKRLHSKEEQDLIRQLDTERDDLLGDMYFNAY